MRSPALPPRPKKLLLRTNVRTNDHHLLEKTQLLDFVGQCAQQQSEEHRELAFTILFELTETVGDVLTAHFDVLQGLFLQALKDPR